MLRKSAFLLAVVLSACGGGAGVSPDADGLALKPCTSTGTVRIQLFGDSTQWEQFGAVQAWMDDRYGAGLVKVSNLGASGTTAADFPASQVEAGAITVVNYGINDSRQTIPSVAIYKERLRKINATIYESPSPPFDTYASSMREVAAERGAVLLDVSARVRAQPGWIKQIHDGVHPNEFLYTWITHQVVGPALAAMVEDRLCLANAQQLGVTTGSSVRVSQNSAGVMWAAAGRPTQGQVTFQNQGRTSALLSFSGLQAPYAISPMSCNVPPRGGTCTVTVSMEARGALGGAGVQILSATGGDNGPVKTVIWGNVTEL